MVKSGDGTLPKTVLDAYYGNKEAIRKIEEETMKYKTTLVDCTYEDHDAMLPCDCFAKKTREAISKQGVLESLEVLKTEEEWIREEVLSNLKYLIHHGIDLFP